MSTLRAVKGMNDVLPEYIAALLRAELARASESLEGTPLAPFRDAAVAVEDAS